MLKLLDRLVIVAYIRSFILVLVSLLSLYIVIDLFTNLEEFFGRVKTMENGAMVERTQSAWQGLANIGTYYVYRSVQIFDRLCESIVLLAGMFTVAWMQRNNELMPLLSAGVPTRRVLRPVLIGATLVMCVGLANQELIIPQVAPNLMRDRNDISGHKELVVQPSYDTTAVHLEAEKAQRDGMLVTDMHVTLPDKQGNGLVHFTAEKATYIPPGPDLYSGGWLLSNTTPATIDGWDNPKLARMIDPGKWFLYTRTVDFDSMTRSSTWYMLFSTPRLNELLHTSDSRRLEAVAVLFHMRMTRPLSGMLLVCMGLAVILRDPNRHVFISSGYCLVITAVFYGAVYGCKFLGDHDLLAPALSAWLPVLGFGPVAFVMFDSIHT